MTDAIVRPDPAREVDATGLACPLPVIELARAISDVDVGATVRLRADDPAARVDVPVWCRMQRHQLDDISDDGRVSVFTVTRGN